MFEHPKQPLWQEGTGFKLHLVEYDCRRASVSRLVYPGDGKWINISFQILEESLNQSESLQPLFKPAVVKMNLHLFQINN